MPLASCPWAGSPPNPRISFLPFLPPLRGAVFQGSVLGSLLFPLFPLCRDYGPPPLWPSVPGPGPAHQRCSVAFRHSDCLQIGWLGGWSGDKEDQVWGSKRDMWEEMRDKTVARLRGAGGRRGGNGCWE